MLIRVVDGAPSSSDFFEKGKVSSSSSCRRSISNNIKEREREKCCLFQKKRYRRLFVGDDR